MKKLQMYLAISLLLIVGLVIGVTQFAVYSKAGTYYLPLYTTIYCAKLEGFTTGTWDLDSSSSASYNFYCGENNLKGYYPYGCDYTVYKNDNKLGVFVRTSSGQEFDMSSLVNTQQRDIKIQQGEYISVQYTGLKSLLDVGDVVIKTQSQGYGLRFNSADGKVAQAGTCDIDQVSSYKGTFKDQKATDANNVLPIGKFEYIIIGQSPVKDPIDIINKDGQAVYIGKTGGYYPTFSENNNIYVDTRPDSFIEDSCIKCIPSQGMCEAVNGCTQPKATISPSDCSKYRGGMLNTYVYVGNNKECTQTCDDTGKLITTSTCREIVKCTAEKPYYDQDRNTCVSFESTNANILKNNWLIPALIIGAFILIAAIIIAIIVKRK